MDLKPSLAEAWGVFGDFHDSVVTRIDFRFDRRGRVVCSVELEGTADTPTLPWYHIRFDFTEVEEWRFSQPRNVDTVIIIFEARWAELDDLVFVAFDGVNIDPAEPTLDDFRATDAYVAARTVEVTLRPL